VRRGFGTATLAGAATVVALFGVAVAASWQQHKLPLPERFSAHTEQIARALTDKPCDPTLMQVLVRTVRDENGCAQALPLIEHAEERCAAETPIVEIGADCHLSTGDFVRARAEGKLLVAHDPASVTHRLRFARALERSGHTQPALHHYSTAKVLVEARPKSKRNNELLARIEQAMLRCTIGYVFIVGGIE
jgi:hypothetical protein